MKEKTKRERSNFQEKSVARRLNGHKQPGSGNQPGYRGDVNTQNILIECKTTNKISYRLEKVIINKIEAEANISNKEWAMIIDISGREVVVLSYDFFKELLESGG